MQPNLSLSSLDLIYDHLMEQGSKPFGRHNPCLYLSEKAERQIMSLIPKTPGTDLANRVTELLIPLFEKESYETILEATAFVHAWVIRSGPVAVMGENFQSSMLKMGDFLDKMTEYEEEGAKKKLAEGIASFTEFAGAGDNVVSFPNEKTRAEANDLSAEGEDQAERSEEAQEKDEDPSADIVGGLDKGIGFGPG